MTWHVLQHVAFEGPARLAVHAQALGYELACHHLYAGDDLPQLAADDALIVMGGPMSVHDGQAHPWLQAEKRLIRQAISAGHRVLGVCLGGQLIAEALGAQVRRNPDKEIGWFELQAHSAGRDWGLPEQMQVLHWHGETFDLPDGAQWLASSAACRHQMFAWGKRVLALQCHLEMDAQALDRIIAHCADEIEPGPWVQSASQMRAVEPRVLARSDEVLRVLLQRWLTV